VRIFAVLDGHGVGGQMAAQFSINELIRRCVRNRLKLENPNNIEKVKESMRLAFSETQEALLNLLNSKNLECGSTAVVCQLVGSTLVIANVGDSRAILVRKWGYF
jgi:serine/threonine protein phosphatase PrpC